MNHPSCRSCLGQGSRWYSSISTWKGGVGAAAMRKDTCDTCWGSCDETRPNLDLRELVAAAERVSAGESAEFLSRRCGLHLTVLKPAILELIKELDRFTRQRKPRSVGFSVLVQALAGCLREMSEMVPP